MNATSPKVCLDPAKIERQSFKAIEALVPEPRPFAGGEWEVARRLVHTSADFELLELLRFSARAVEAGVAALRSGAAIVTDTRMCQAGIPARRLDPLGCRTLCYMDDPDIEARARELGVTKARLAVERASEISGPVIFAVGNAPTALLRLLEMMDQGMAAPDLVIGMPVGFVNAAESKDLLLKRRDVEYIAIQGRKGGSALAAACVNALAELALRARPV